MFSEGRFPSAGAPISRCFLPCFTYQRPPSRTARPESGKRMKFQMHMRKWQWAVLAGIVAVINVPFLVRAMRPAQDVTVQLPFEDDFSRTEIGRNYFTGGGFWRIVNGRLQSPGVKNNPLWLNAVLPDDVAIEFDASSSSTEGDIKCEIFGNGWDHASGYVLVLSGWSNKISIIARKDEHGRDRKENRNFRVEKGRAYHFRIERRKGVIDWFVDGQKILSFDDKKPLGGKGNDRFGFSSWDTELFFDNLKITAL